MKGFKNAVIADVKRRSQKKLVRTKLPIDNIMDQTTKTEKAKLLQITTDIRTRLINIKQDALHVGHLLNQAKKILPHGKFQPWIEYFFKGDISYSTAYFYMRIYDTFEGCSSSVKNIPTTYLLMLTQKNFPKEIIELIKKHPEKFDNKNFKMLNEVYSLFKKGTIGGSQFLKLAEDQIKIGIEIAHKSTLHRINLITRLSFEWGAGDIMKRIRNLRQIARSMAGLYPYDPESAGHKKLIDDIDKTIDELKKLKIDLEGGRGFFRSISTKDGVESRPNSKL